MNHSERIELSKTSGWVMCFVIGMFCLMIYGLAWLSSVTVTAGDVYVRRGMAKEIKDLRIEYGNHVHRYFDGRIKNE